MHFKYNIFLTKKLYSVSELVAEFHASEKKNQGIRPLANQRIYGILPISLLLKPT